MHVERTFTVPRPVEAVYDYLSDFTHTTEWDPGTNACTRTSGDGGVGTTYANTSTFLGREVDLTYTTVAADRPSTLRFEGRHPKASACDAMTFSRAADGTATQIHYRADFQFSRLVSLVAPILVKPGLEKLADQTVEQLQATLLNIPTT